MIPLFIRTTGRTGSTLLLNLLKSSPSILVRGNYPFEERLLSYFYRLSQVPFYGQKPIPGSHWNYESVNLPCGLIGLYPGEVPIVPDPLVGQSIIFKALWEAYLKCSVGEDAAKLKFLAEKTGNDIATVNNYVYCKNIFLIRDPRDQLASMRDFDRKRGYKGFGHSSGEGVNSVRSLCGSIRDIMKIASEISLDDERRMVIRYEDLIQNRDDILRRLGDWLKISFDLTEFEQENVQYRDAHSTSESQQSSIGRWRHLVTDEEAAIFHEEVGPIMDKLGYC
jgi:hypothetical protein